MARRGKNARTVTLGLVQMRCGDKPADNLDKAIERIRRAARDGADVVCLQELFRSRYFCQKEDVALFRLAETIPGPTTRALAKLAREKRIVVVASLFEKRADGVYHNTAVVLDADGTIVGKYRKMHIPDDPLYYEKFYFTPGDLGFRSFATRRAKIGTLVCWDQWFPEGARLTALARRRDPRLSDGDRLARRRGRRTSTSRSATLGKRRSARTRSPTACSSRP